MPPEADTPGLRFLHSPDTLNRVKPEFFRRLSTVELKESLAPGQPGPLKARIDGTVFDGHHRICILIERGEQIDRLPRGIIDKQQ